MTAGQLVGVLDEALLLHVHQDLLPTDGTDVLGRTPAGDPSSAVELEQPRQRQGGEQPLALASKQKS